MKASPKSTLQSSNNGLIILTIWEEKVEFFELVRKYAAKSEFPTFLKNIEISRLGPKYRSEIFRNRKSTSEKYLQDAD